MFNNDGEDSGSTPAAPQGGGPPDNSGEVLRMSDFDTARPGQILLELRAYWESLRKGRAIPDRADV